MNSCYVAFAVVHATLRVYIEFHFEIFAVLHLHAIYSYIYLVKLYANRLLRKLNIKLKLFS